MRTGRPQTLIRALSNNTPAPQYPECENTYTTLTGRKARRMHMQSLKFVILQVSEWWRFLGCVK